MERCDFASICAVIRRYLLAGAFDSQMDFVETLFDSYLQETHEVFDNGQLNKWLNGILRLSPDIREFYQKEENCEELAVTILDAIIPFLSDSGMVVREIHDLLIHDTSVSSEKKDEFCEGYPCHTNAQKAAFLAKVLDYGVIRDFKSRDIRKPELLPSVNCSPALCDYISEEGVPKPCRHFCGRESELKAVHEILLAKGKLFLRGIPGIGKSELAKAYAKAHKKEYANILFITWSGSLKRDIAELSFSDDLPSESDEERFRRHNQFLRTLKPDTLLIIDNFNATDERDKYLPVVLNYRCRVLITTRSNLPDRDSVLVEEIADGDALFGMCAKLYGDAEENRAVLERIIETVHRHTLAVELAARLLETGMLEPREVLEKLRSEGASFDAADKINVSKDGKRSRATYYDHIHTLFGLFRLADDQREIMRCMSLIPQTGIHARLFGQWMGFRDLNDVNEMEELGFLESMPGRKITLHPMVKDVAVSEFPPSVTECHIMLENIRAVCQAHGVDVPYYKVLFQTVENTVAIAQEDNTGFYLRLLEDAFQYMESYRYEQGMKLIIAEMGSVLSDESVGTASDRAVLLDCKACCADTTEEAIRFLEEALALLPEINADNALLASNLNSNLGSLYRMTKRLDLAKRRMERGVEILYEYNLIGGHDSLIQILTYMVLLNDMGDPQSGLSGLLRLEELVRKENPDSADHAMILKTTGYLFLSVRDIEQATRRFARALAIYYRVYANDPEAFAKERDEIAETCGSIGLSLNFPADWLA